MKLLIAIVQAEDADILCARLNEHRLRATRIGTAGGFLAQANVTLLIGVEDRRVEEVLRDIRATCRTRCHFVNLSPAGVEAIGAGLVMAAMPLEVEIGGATVFSLPVRQFVRTRGGALDVPDREVDSGQDSSAAGWPAPESKSANHAMEVGRMNLVISVVHREDTDLVIGGLLAAGYRVTRINTVGAFLRRGNVTLLIGVEGENVEDVLWIIQANCRNRDEPSPLSAGLPAYSATTFVLDVARLVRA
jgi:uncharacterized protein YaaQ